MQRYYKNGPKINRPGSRQEGRGLSAAAMHDDLGATLGADAISYQVSAICQSHAASEKRD
jgi:hypothetical protein